MARGDSVLFADFRLLTQFELRAEHCFEPVILFSLFIWPEIYQKNATRQKIDTNVNVRFGNADNYFKTNNQLTLENQNPKSLPKSWKKMSINYELIFFRFHGVFQAILRRKWPWYPNGSNGCRQPASFNGLYRYFFLKYYLRAFEIFHQKM